MAPRVGTCCRLAGTGAEGGRRGLLRAMLAGIMLPLLLTQHPRSSAAEEKLGDDEFVIQFGDGPIGLDLTEVRFPANVPPAKQSSRVIISSIKPGSQAEKLGKPYRLRPQLLLVSVNGQNVEGMRAKDVINLVLAKKKESDEFEDTPLRLVFRDPLIFKEKLLNSEPGSVVETQVGPQGSEKLIVNVTKVPEQCGAIRTQQGDLIEVKYTGYLADTMEVFDGTSINAQGNYFGDNTLYFVLNQGVPKGKIVPKLPVPPNARLIYDIKLVGINGLNTPSDDASALGERVPYDYQV